MPERTGPGDPVDPRKKRHRAQRHVLGGAVASIQRAAARWTRPLLRRWDAARVGALARAAVEADRARPEGGNHQHAAGDRYVLPEVDVLAHVRGLVGIPVVVEDEGGEDREAGERKAGPACEQAEDEHQSAAQLDDDGQHGQHRGQGQALGRDVARRPLETHDLAEARHDEHQAEQDAAGKSHLVLVLVLHLKFLSQVG